MRYTEAAPLASAPQHHSHHRDHHSHHSGGQQQQQAHPRAAPTSTTGPGSAATVVGVSPAVANAATAAAAPSVMSGDLSEQRIFSPGAVVKAVTCHHETITGEVLSFEYDSRLLILSKFACHTRLISLSDATTNFYLFLSNF